ncbi:MAG: DNA primase [Patescibacteria group bacterium]|nr:DNA primase [Patescibacteria group bacterium]
MSETVDEIKNKLDLIDVVREYVPNLKQVGANWKSPCPFHKEKTPSFFVSPDRQIWHCFGCGAGGDMFEFIKKIEGIEFAEALKILANKAGVEIKRDNPEVVNQRTQLMDVCSQAANFYHQVLLKTAQAEKAREYLKQRNLSDQTIQEFKLGFAPESWDSLVKALKTKDFLEIDIQRAGLALSKNGQKYYDRFRNRIMFPIQDTHGNMVGFTGRTLDPNESAKYVNTPETSIFNKSKILYGLDKAKKYIREEKLAIIVEGQMDVLASHQAGIKNVVAASGTALTLDQIKLIKRYAENIALAFDVDLAGQEATKRGIANAWQENLNVKIIQLKAGKDPDECIQQDVKLWQESIQQARPIMEHYFDIAFKDKDLSQVENRKQASKILLPIIAQLNNKIDQEFWLKKIADKIEVRIESLFEILEKFNSKQTSKPMVVEKFKNTNRQLSLMERYLAMLIKYPKLRHNLIQNFDWQMFEGYTQLEGIVKILNEYYNKQEVINEDLFNQKNFCQLLNQDEQNYLDVLNLLVAKENFNEWDERELKSEILKISQDLQKIFIQDQLRQIELKIKKTEEDGDEEQLNELFKQFNQLAQELASLN